MASPIIAQEPCPGPLPADDCTSAPIFCQVMDLDGYCFSMSADLTPAGPGLVCDQGGALDNTHWVAFVASCPSFVLTVSPSNCEDMNGQIGIQVAVYDYGGDGYCPSMDAWPQEVIACQSNPCFSNPVSLTLDNLRIGGLYFLLVDGCGGSVCDVSFSVDTPCDSMGIGDWPFIMTGPDSLCTGSTAGYQVFQPVGASYFQWLLDGEEFAVTTDNQLPVTWPEAGTYQLCVRAGNACIPPDQGPVPNCLTIDVFQVEAQDPPPVLLCIGESHPYPGGPYGPGEWTITLETAQGCDSVVTLVVQVDSADVDLGDFVLCTGDTLRVLDQPFTCQDAGPQQVLYQKDTPPFCFGWQRFGVHCFEAAILPHLEIHDYPFGRMQLYARTFQDASGRYFTYQWSTEDGILSDTSDQSMLVVWEPGMYCLTVAMYSPDSVLICERSVCTRVLAREAVEPSSGCAQAPLLCSPRNIHEVQMSKEITGQGPTPICTQGGAPHNTHWLAFHAPAPAFRLVVEPSNCVPVGGQNGIQAVVYRFAGDGLCSGIFDDPPQEVGCQSTPCFINPWHLNLQNLEVGGLYYLLIDGCAGATCDVAIRFTDLPDTLPTPSWVGDLEGQSERCVGDPGGFRAPAGPSGTRYHWTLNDSLIHSGTFRELEIDFPDVGQYTLCVTPELPCDPAWGATRQTCMQITVHAVPRRAGRDVYVCRDDYVTVHGVHWGCAFEGVQEIVYQQSEAPYCDSIRTFRLICLSPAATILNPEPLSDSTWLLDGGISDLGPSGAQVSLHWSASGGGQILGPDDGITAQALGAGLYCLRIRTASPNGAVHCEDVACVGITEGRRPEMYRSAPEVPSTGIRIYPQPAGSVAWLTFGGDQDPAGQIVVYNPLGQLVLDQWKPEGERLMSLSLDPWPAGLYLLAVHREGQPPVTLRLLVAR